MGPAAPVLIVAEIGINHGGDAAVCARLIEAAAAAGADAVKLQVIDPDESYVRGSVSHTEFTGKDLHDADLSALMRMADRLNVLLFATPGDFPSLVRVTRLGMPAVKISSGLMTNLPLVAEASRQGVPVIMSTGLAHEDEIAEAVAAVHGNGNSGLALLKCTALYPAPDATVNLAALPALRKRFGVPVGYSDHTLDDLACTAAVALGAVIIEKHFTLDRTQPGADHRISLEPASFAALVQRIRRVEAMRGDAHIGPSPQEERLRAERHRCLVARRTITAGEPFTRENVGLKRPLSGHGGLSPRYYDRVLGRVAAISLRKDDPIGADAVPGLM